jgi:antitoxin component YwqK of YwqJK toxin-antitoxin module
MVHTIKGIHMNRQHKISGKYTLGFRKGTFFACLMLLPGIFLSAQPLDYKDGKYYKNDMLYTGKHIDYYAGGSIKSEMNISNGVEDGLVIFYYENGNRQEQRCYKDGKKDGLWINWNEQGVKIAEASYKDDEKDGRWLIWNDQSVLLYEMYYAASKKTGTWKMWDKDGVLLEVRKY